MSTPRLTLPFAGIAAAGAVSIAIVMADGRGSAALPLLAAASLLAAVIWIAWQDVRTFSIPDGALLVVAAVAIALRLASPVGGALDEMMALALDAGLCGGALLAVREGYYRLRGIDGLGFGDVKLAAACGLLVGTTDFAVALFAASAAGLMLVLAATLVRPGCRIERLPFGALLAPACWCLWVIATVPP